MHKALPLLILLSSVAISKASWINFAADNTATKSQMVLNASSEQIVIDHGLELYRSLQNHESDCFRKVTLSLNEGCNSLTYDSVQNMEFALMLTLCELGSAKWKLPKVCFEISETSNKVSERSIKQCVKRLSETPQTWTSYSGYFRDVFLMCFAIRYPMEKEILEQLHRNITANQAKNFDILQEQQNYLVKWRSEEFNTLNKIKDVQKKLLNQMEKVRGTHAKSADQIQLIFDALVLLQNQTEAVILKYNYLVKYHVGEVENQLNQLVIRQELEVDHVMSTVVSGLQRINQNIEEMIFIQQEALQSFSHSKDIQQEYLEAWTESIIDVNKELNSFLNESLANVKNLHSDISSIHQQIKTVTKPLEGVLDIFSNFYASVQQVFLNLLMYGSLLHLIDLAFEYQSLTVRAVIMIFISTALHYTLNNALPTDYPHMTLTKSLIILAEWSIRGIFFSLIQEADVEHKVFLDTSEDNNAKMAEQIVARRKSPSIEKNSTKSENDQICSFEQLQKAPVIRTKHSKRKDKVNDYKTKDAKSEDLYDGTSDSFKNSNEGHERFPVYQFHKYYR